MKGGVWKYLAAIPAVVLALIAHLAACPACWPLVGGLMSALGVTTVVEGRFMVPVFIGSTILAMIPLGIEARRYMGPFLLGSGACVLLWNGRIVFDIPAVTFSGIVCLVGAYGWSYFLRRKRGAPCCTTCKAPSSTIADMPIACTLDKNQFAERKALLDQLVRRAEERKDIPQGLAFRFRSEHGLLSQLANFVELESACCPFLSFQIDVRAGGDIWLNLSGPKAAQSIIRDLIPEA